mgnify:CR=1 FL=1
MPMEKQNTVENQLAHTITQTEFDSDYDKTAKKLLANYWGEYTTLGDSFLENIQGLTTLKIYQADGWKHEQMNAQAERFRRITMKVLTMQLNSVTLMDLMAYGGAGLGIISAVAAFAAGRLTLTATLTIVLLAADFFLPLRLLGSYFHIAMNGAASAEKIFKLLAAEEPADGDRVPGENTTLKLEHITFGYEKDRTILNDVSFTIPQGSFVSLVGESGCGKSTIAALLSGSRTGYTGSVTLGGKILSVADDCKVFRVSADGEEIYASSASSIVKDQGTYADKVWYKTTDGEVTTIVIQTVDETVTPDPTPGDTEYSATIDTNLLTASVTGSDAVASAKQNDIKNAVANAVKAAGYTVTAWGGSYNTGDGTGLTVSIVLGTTTSGVPTTLAITYAQQA